MRKIKVAAIQAMSVAGDFAEKWQGADVEHALELLEEAAAKCADLACFPELYPLVGKEALCEKARQHGMYVIAGLADGSRECWYNTSVIISPAGEIVGQPFGVRRGLQRLLVADEADESDLRGRH